MTRIRKYISPNEWEMIKEYRETSHAMAQTAKDAGIDPKDVPYYWYKSPRFSLFVRSPELDYDTLEQKLIDAVKALAHKRNYRPRGKPTQAQGLDPHLVVIDIADPHIGKLAPGENLRASVAELQATARRLVDKAYIYNPERIVMVAGNDALHFDNDRYTTTKGTPVDPAGLLEDVYQAAFVTYVSLVEEMATIAPVHYVHVPSNHDAASGWMMSKAVEAYFSRWRNVTFDVSRTSRKYIQYGASLIGMTHGHNGKPADLPDLMKSEARRAWASSRYGYWYVHHLHHKIRKTAKGKGSKVIEKDYGDVMVIGNEPPEMADGVYVEYVRSPSAADRWHDDQGYKGSPRALEMFIHHPEAGQVMRHTEYV